MQNPFLDRKRILNTTPEYVIEVTMGDTADAFKMRRNVANCTLEYSADLLVWNPVVFSPSFSITGSLKYYVRVASGTFDQIIFYLSQMISVEVLDTSAFTTCLDMFNFCQKLTTLPATLELTGITRFDSMFDGCDVLTAIPTINTSSGEYFDSMFGGCYLVTTFPALDTTNAISFNGMFTNCDALTPANVPVLDTTNGPTMDSMFSFCGSMISIPAIDMSNSSSFQSMFRGASLVNPVLTGLGANANCFNMFQGCTSMLTIDITLPVDFNSISDIVRDCSSLTKVTIDAPSGNTGSFYSAFRTCVSLTCIGGYMDTRTASTTQYMFLGSSSIANPTGVEQTAIQSGAEYTYVCSA